MDKLFCEWLAEKDVETMYGGTFKHTTFPEYAAFHGKSDEEIKEYLSYGTQS